jgi:protein-L-isoaspartate O-methyltransferase
VTTGGYRRLVDAMARSGSLGDGWRGAFLRTPRAGFVPDRIWLEEPGGTGHREVVRADDPEAWQAAVDTDAVLVTQRDDGADGGPGVATSSASMPSLVARMLTHLAVAPGSCVLEIGTGTGWSTALLCARLGDRHVTSVEIDPAVAARAGTALARAGHSPRLVVGDGTLGWPQGAPYDRVSATASAARVPHAWVRQCRDGGLVLTPWGTPFCNAGLLRLRVTGQGESACGTGRFVDSVNFMWLRGQRPAVDKRSEQDEPARTGPSAFDPAEALASVHVAFAIGLRVPGVRYRVVWDAARPRETYRLLLCDGAGSRAVARFVEWRAADAVGQAGPRRLWDEVVAARHWWEERGRPQLTRFGVTVTHRRQAVWLDRPDSVVVADANPGGG